MVIFSFKKRRFDQEQLDYCEQDHLKLVDYLRNDEINIILDRIGMFSNQFKLNRSKLNYLDYQKSKALCCHRCNINSRHETFIASIAATISFENFPRKFVFYPRFYQNRRQDKNCSIFILWNSKWWYRRNRQYKKSLHEKRYETFLVKNFRKWRNQLFDRKNSSWPA